MLLQAAVETNLIDVEDRIIDRVKNVLLQVSVFECC